MRSRETSILRAPHGLATVLFLLAVARPAIVRADDAPPAPPAPVATEEAPPPPIETATPPPPPVKPPVQTPVSEQEHGGFFFRAELGLGWMQASGPVPGASLGISGLDGAFSLAAGGAITNNLVIAGEVWTHSVSAPTLRLNGEKTSTTNDLSLTLAALGPNITYYVMPANVYASLTPSLGRLSVRDGRSGEGGATQLGFASRLSVGKEWWVARHLGIGVAGTVVVAFNQDETTIGATTSKFFWTTLAGGLAFVGTYD